MQQSKTGREHWTYTFPVWVSAVFSDIMTVHFLTLSNTFCNKVSSKRSSALKAFRCHISLCLFFLFFPMSSAVTESNMPAGISAGGWVDTHCFSWRRGWRRSAAYWFRSGHWCPDSGSQQRRRWGSVSTCCHTAWSACSPPSHPACSWGENASKPIREDYTHKHRVEELFFIIQWQN